MIPNMAISLYGPPGPDFLDHIGKTAYLFSVPAMTMGVSNLFWIPLTIKYGRRPIYLASYMILTASLVWTSRATSYASIMAARVVTGLGAGAVEVLVPLTVADIFFLHERGAMMM
jgi:MFS family permease